MTAQIIIFASDSLADAIFKLVRVLIFRNLHCLGRLVITYGRPTPDIELLRCCHIAIRRSNIANLFAVILLDRPVLLIPVRPFAGRRNIEVKVVRIRKRHSGERAKHDPEQDGGDNLLHHKCFLLYLVICNEVSRIFSKRAAETRAAIHPCIRIVFEAMCAALYASVGWTANTTPMVSPPLYA